MEQIKKKINFQKVNFLTTLFCSVCKLDKKDARPVNINST